MDVRPSPRFAVADAEAGKMASLGCTELACKRSSMRRVCGRDERRVRFCQFISIASAGRCQKRAYLLRCQYLARNQAISIRHSRVLPALSARITKPLLFLHRNHIIVNRRVVAVLVVWSAAAVAKDNLVRVWAVSTLARLAHGCLWIPSIWPPLLRLLVRFGDGGNICGWFVHSTAGFRLCRNGGVGL
jgi:hypothetical protein